MRSKLNIAAALAAALVVASAAQAIPLLGTGAGDWSYDSSSHSWGTSDIPFQLVASAGSPGGTAYLTVAGLSSGRFSLTVSDDGGALQRVMGGSLFGIYFEVYRFDFDNAVAGVLGGAGGGASYLEHLQVAIHSLGGGVKGLGFVLGSRWNGLGNVLKVNVIGDAGKVPEPGAVGVFSMGLLVAGALIRRLRRPS